MPRESDRTVFLRLYEQEIEQEIEDFEVKVELEMMDLDLPTEGSTNGDSDAESLKTSLS